ncbi:annexin-B12-like isoform X2 [Xenia sp. Carnegie-2017]|uniref:annexin-B12-like isoform X2 n=1 Tax=Xenia sp. Carnegie-2017 TaxID=2897299 RepID=UPI001F049D0A|nr:annexin-B12-like isoform X2 [Xenia sp. Carnegie-2017]
MSYPPGYPGYPPIPQTPQSGPAYPPRNDVEGIGFEKLMIGPSYPPQPTVPYPTGPVPFSGYEAPPASYGPIYPETTHGASQFPMPSGINFGTAANVAHAATAFQAPVRPMPTSYPITNPPYPSGPPSMGASTSMQYAQQHVVQTKGNSFHGISSAPSAPFAHHQPQSYHGTPSKPSTTHSTPSRPTQQPSVKANRGTVKPCASFNPQADAEVIRKAVGGVGTNVKAIVSILSTRNNQQRRKIALEYKTQFGRDLNTDLKYAVSGNLENLLLAMMRSPLESDAVELRKAMKGAGTDESVLIEILCSRTNTEIDGIKKTYKNLHGRDLEKDVISETSGHFKKFLVSLLQANRDESMNVDYDRARADAHALYTAGEKRWGTDEARFNAILASRSFPQLRATFNEYAKSILKLLRLL